MSQVIVDPVMLQEPRLMVPMMQPLGNVKISAGSPYSREIFSACIFSSIYPIDLVTNRICSAVGNTYAPHLETTGIGRGVQSSTSETSNLIVPGISTIGFSGSIHTWLAVAAVSSVASEKSILDTDPYPVLRHCQFRINTSSKLEAISFDTGGTPYFAYSDNTISLNRPFVAIMRRSGSYCSVILNGGVEVSTTISNTPQSSVPSAISVGGSQSGTSDDCLAGGAVVYFTAIWNRMLSVAECADLARNPYQFLIPA